MYLRIVGAATLSLLLVSLAEYTRRVCGKKDEQIKTPGLPDGKYKELEKQLNILHPLSMLLWFLGFSPLLLIPSVLGLGRDRLLAQLGIAGIVTAAFWIGKHFERKWASRWLTDALTFQRGVALALAGIITVCCLYVLLSDPQAAKREIIKAFKTKEPSTGAQHEP